MSNTENPYNDIVETIQFKAENFFEEIGDKTYINPLLYFQITENPFKSEKRNFPVYYNYPRADQVQIKLNIPEKYVVESIPEPVEITLPDNLGVFKYNIVQKNDNLEIKTTMIINEPVIAAQHYTALKEFYKQIIKKEAEKIILSKK